jgi:hypothetical protein
MPTSTVSYNGKKIQPAPLVNITKNYLRANNGEIIGSTFNIVVNGTLFAYKGSPTSSGTFNTGSNYLPDETISADSRLTATLRKQDALRELFSEDGHSFEIQAADGAEPLKCYPRITGPIQFPEGIWFDICPYTITLEADQLLPEEEDVFTSNIIDAQESWNIETQEEPEGLDLPRTYRLTHSVSAVGKRTFDAGILLQDAWKNARDFVLPKLGFDNTFLISSGVKDLPSYYGGYNHVRNEVIDKMGGSYAVTETWLLTSGTALEDFTVDTNTSIDNGTVQVNIQGNIIGLESRYSAASGIGSMDVMPSGSKYNNALARYNISSGLAFTRAQTYSGYNLNIIPAETRVGKNPITGSINYSYTFDNRPSNVFSGALSENITVNDTFDEYVVALIPILGRAAGPILQPINTKQASRRELSIEVVMPTVSFGSGESSIRAALFTSRPTANLSGIINAANPAGQGFTSYQVSNTENWNPKSGRYSRNIGWLYQ